MPHSAPRWKYLVAALVGLGATASFAAYDWLTPLPPGSMNRATYVGRQTCAECHQKEHRLWQGSDHDRAMEIATEESVLGDFNDATFTRHGMTTRFFRQGDKFMVNTEGPDGEMRDFEIKYTFGVRPLQQYMVEFPDGRVQVLRISWDTEKKEWFDVTPPDVPDERIEPGDPLHWTGIAQNWNTTCADCHSTNVHKGYNADKDTYRTTFEEIDVSCEECHGPGSVHVELARKWSPFWDREIGYGLTSLKVKESNVQLEMCAKCHSRRYQVREGFRPGHPLLDYYEPFVLTSGMYHCDGQIQDEVYEYGSFVQSKMHANHVRCTDCHDPHSLKLKFPGNQLCTQCHLPAKYDTPAHHYHPPDSAGAKCIECHMPERLYMVVDGRRDHSFRVPRPDLSVELGTPNACNDCHTKPEETPQWAADAIVKWYGPKRADDHRWAAAFAAARATKPEAEAQLLEVLQNAAATNIVRATAIDLLASYPSSASIEARRSALKHSDPLVRVTAVRSLSGQSDNLLVADLASMLEDPVLFVRVAAASRLAYLPLEFLTSQQRASFDRAMVEFRKSQELSLDHAGGHLALGSLDRRSGRPEEAIKHLESAIKLEPYMVGPRAELASMMQQYGGSEADIRRLREQEAELMERDARLAPDNAGIFYQLGMLRYLLGDFDKAQAALSTGVEKSPRNFDLLMALALLHEKRFELDGGDDQFTAAVETLKKMNDLQPNDPRTRGIFARLLATRQSKQGNPPAPTTEP